MIISASRRTDIPAFYSDWFMQRVQAQCFMRVNPFNPKQKKIISLNPTDVDAIVFWTKNPRPIMQHLDTLTQMGYHYYFQFTLNDYPLLFEPRLPDLTARIDTFRELSDSIGRDRVIWRFDPVILSSITPVEYLEDRFGQLAAKLSGYTQRVMISFLDIYGKVKPRLRMLKDKHGVLVEDITLPLHHEGLMQFAAAVSRISAANHLTVFTCSEAMDLSNIGIEHGACIDGQLIETLFGVTVNAKKDRKQRKACLCAEAVDMGFYNTCRFGCTYCYANISDRAVQNAIEKHGLNSPLSDSLPMDS